MALKITKKIGTDQGITSEAYVRIVNYNINKNGIANFALQTFLSQNDVPALISNTPGAIGTVRNNAIGDTFQVFLQKEVEEKYMVTKPVQKEVEIEQVISTTDADGNPTTETVTQKVMQTVLEEVEEIRVALVPDLTLLEGKDIFQYAYGKLKEKLVAEFGASYVKDC
jgi:hypothetical protein